MQSNSIHWKTSLQNRQAVEILEGEGTVCGGGAGYVREKCVKLTCISSAAVTDDAIGPSIQTTGIAVLISTSLAARAHARPTRVSGTRTRVTIVTISAPAHAQTRRTGVVFGRLSMSMSMSIIDLYSTESRSISTALCALSGSSSATTVWTTYTRQIVNQQVPCSLDREVTISPYLQYTSNLTKDISLLVYCLTMFDVCHMFVLKYYLRPIFNSF